MVRTDNILGLVMLAAVAVTVSACGPDGTSMPATAEDGRRMFYSDAELISSVPLACELHAEKTVIRMVPIIYGLRYFLPADYSETRRTLFPYARIDVSGGCMGGPDSEVRARRCESCTAAERAWLDTYYDP